MTDYTLRVTIACPAAMLADANEYALCTGESDADDRTFNSATYEDASGNLYAVASTVAKSDFATRATDTLSAPAHAPDVNLAAADRAQAALYIYGTHGFGGATPDRLWAMVEPAPGDARAALALAGLTPYEPDLDAPP